jgi:hypothetical protein
MITTEQRIKCVDCRLNIILPHDSTIVTGWCSDRKYGIITVKSYSAFREWENLNVKFSFSEFMFSNSSRGWVARFVKCKNPKIVERIIFYHFNQYVCFSHDIAWKTSWTSLIYIYWVTTYTSLSLIWRGFAPVFVNYKKGALDLQPHVIKLTSCLPTVGGSLWVLRLLPYIDHIH